MCITALTEHEDEQETYCERVCRPHCIQDILHQNSQRNAAERQADRISLFRELL